jgi:adenosylcobyric acid synthase
MAARAVMVVGTASNVGKSWLATGLCRLLRRAGIRVAPFKAQNMSNNAFATKDGGEIGWAQAAQAEAAGLEPTVDMNPILLKPTSETGSQVIVRGRIHRTMAAGEFPAFRAEAKAAIEASYARLAREFDLIVIEGAGSPAEVNLRDRDLANLWMARLAGATVLLVADASGAGALASAVGTLALLAPDERACVLGLVLNQCPGPLPGPSRTTCEYRTGLPLLGAVPRVADLWIPGEDSVVLESDAEGEAWASAPVRIGVVWTPRIANFTDFDPLRLEPGVSLRYARRPEEVAEADLILLPGSKNTIGDLEYLRGAGIAAAIARARRFGAMVGGLCGGYQMLGRWVDDSHGMEGPPRRADGLGLLEVTTVLSPAKATYQVTACVEPGCPWPVVEPLEGYEIHLGETGGVGEAVPLLALRRRGAAILDGAVTPDGSVWGTYLHGIFDNPGFRRAVVNAVRRAKGLPSLDAPLGPTARAAKEAQYDRLADVLRRHLDWRRVCEAVGLTA